MDPLFLLGKLCDRFNIDPVILGAVLSVVIMLPITWRWPWMLLISVGFAAAGVLGAKGIVAWFHWAVARQMARDYPEQQPQTVQRDEKVFPPAEQRRNAGLN